jgi:hypothetical protein
MITYFANPSTPGVREAMADGRLGAILTPRQGNRLPAASLFVVDNGCGPTRSGAPGSGYCGDERYLGMLQDLGQGDGYDPCDPDTSWCLFAVAPDGPGDAAATLRRGRTSGMLGWIRWLGFPVALVAQNGLEDLTVPWDDFDVLFIGGDTAWKLGRHARTLTAEAKRRRKWVHMGRVNSLERLRYAEATGCDSADGTFIAFGPDVNLPHVLGWLRSVNDQGALFGLEASA